MDRPSPTQHRRTLRGAMMALLAVCFLSVTSSGHACATCMGSPESPLTQGLNWGIFSLLAVVMFVLSGVAAFFVYIARRAAAFQRGELALELESKGSRTVGTTH